MFNEPLVTKSMNFEVAEYGFPVAIGASSTTARVHFTICILHCQMYPLRMFLSFFCFDFGFGVYGVKIPPASVDRTDTKRESSFTISFGRQDEYIKFSKEERIVPLRYNERSIAGD